LKTEYKRDLKNNYLVIEPDTEVNLEEYVVHMTEQNTIPGLLPMQVRRMDGTCYLYYEITSCQPMDSLYEKKSFGSQEILHILSEMQDVLESARRYLLNPQQILFDPCYMYINEDNTHMLFCYYPVSANSSSVVTLAEYILKKLNHEDARAVSLGYSFYQHATEENFSLSETLHKILEDNWKESHRPGKEWRESAGSGETKQEDLYQTPLYKTYNSNEEWTEKKQDRRQDKKSEDYLQGDELFHKERKSRSGKGRKKRLADRIFRFVHPVILILVLLISAGLEVVYYYEWINLTEAGGVLFLTLAAAILCNRFWKKRRDKKEKKKGGRADTGWKAEADRIDDWRNVETGRADGWQNSESSGENDWRKSEVARADNRWEMASDRRFGRGDNRDIRGRNDWVESDIKEGRDRERKEWDAETADPMSERTQYLYDTVACPAEILLVSEVPDKYPTIHVKNKIVIVGKTKGQADVLLQESTVSRIHARLEKRDNICYIRDMNSRNGTYVNGVRLKPQEQMQIREGDCVMFANVRYYVETEKEDDDRTQLLSH
jgi:hypothetical protein